MKRINQSPGRTFRRSQVALCFGFIFVGLASCLAYLLHVPAGDIFAGFMAGSGAVGALMAAYEAADASENSARAAQLSNEIYLMDTKPILSLWEKIDQRSKNNNFGQMYNEDYISKIVISNIGKIYTNIIDLKIYVYHENEKKLIEESCKRHPIDVNTEKEIAITMNFDQLVVSNIDGYAVEAMSIHGTKHNAIGIKKGSSFQVEQLYNSPIPDKIRS